MDFKINKTQIETIITHLQMEPWKVANPIIETLINLPNIEESHTKDDKGDEE